MKDILRIAKICVIVNNMIVHGLQPVDVDNNNFHSLCTTFENDKLVAAKEGQLTGAQNVRDSTSKAMDVGTF